ncbi:MAG: hypothetical protein FWG50_13320 [Kiritimatiellaeota bacterium]|nr:hypothetical protein [Kiritimatiellota bacterium]
MKWTWKYSLGAIAIALAVALVVTLCFCAAKETAGALADLLGSLLGIVLGSYFIQRLVNRESNLKETSRWLIQKIEEYEKDACECCFLAEEDSQRRIILASKLKSDFPALVNIFDICVHDKVKQNKGNRDWKILFDAATGDNFEFSPLPLADVRPKIQLITRSCSQLKRIIAQYL